VNQPTLTVLVPAYNEEAGLGRSVELILAKLAELGVSAEVLIVDDGSRDRTPAIADELAACHSQVRAFHHPANRGIGGGFVTGAAQARGEWLILIPADLALDLDELRKYLDAARRADVVVGARSDRRDYSAFRLFVAWVNIRLIQLLFGMKLRQFNYISMYRTEVLRRIEIEYWRSAFFHAEKHHQGRAKGVSAGGSRGVLRAAGQRPGHGRAPEVDCANGDGYAALLAATIA
jgi:dolichol-phosphate mannosyltransferase